MAKETHLSGFKDLLAEQMIPRQSITETIRKVYEDYGFVPLDTPAIERLETLQGKYGDEGEKLMYKLTDHGGRMLALRYDLTVPLARVVAQHREKLPLPYKRYQIGKVWRGESPQAGRYREFTQFDADTVGTESIIADAEIAAMTADAMTALGVEAIVKINNRRILDALAETIGIEDEARIRSLVGAIDKLGKVGKEKTLTKLTELFDSKSALIVEAYLDAQGTTSEKLQHLEKILSKSSAAEEGINNIAEVFSILEGSGYSEQIIFDQTIARGLDYYTGIIYETTLSDFPQLGSISGGGRYDNLISALGGPDLPAVGASIGVDRLIDGLSKSGKIEAPKTLTQALIVNFNESHAPEYMHVATQLRNAGIPAEIFHSSDRISKQLKFANKMGIPFVVFLGPDELSQNTVQIKNLDTGNQKTMPLSKLAESISDIIK